MRPALVALALIPALLVAAAGRGQCDQTMTIDVGAYGGANIPVAQEDTSTGALFGFRGRLGFPYGTIEPSVNFLGHGDGSNGRCRWDGDHLPGPEVLSMAINYLVGPDPSITSAGMGWSAIDIPGGVGESDEALSTLGSAPSSASAGVHRREPARLHHQHGGPGSAEGRGDHGRGQLRVF